MYLIVITDRESKEDKMYLIDITEKVEKTKLFNCYNGESKEDKII